MTVTGLLLRLYPRRWRDRYGDEFLSLVDGQHIGVRRFIDIVSGAADAHLSSDIRNLAAATGSAGHPNTGVPTVMKILRAGCASSPAPMSRRTGAIGAAIIIGSALAFAAAEMAARRYAFPRAVGFLAAFSTPAATLAGTTFMFMQGVPWKAKAAFIGGTLTILAVICAGASYR